MIQSNNHYLYRPVEKLEVAVEVLDSCFKTLRSVELTREMKVKALDKVFRLLNAKVPADLEELTWSVKTLDREKDRVVLFAAFDALNKLQNVLSFATAAISSGTELWGAGFVGKEIDSISLGLLAEARRTTQEKITKLGSEAHSAKGPEEIPSLNANLMPANREIRPFPALKNNFWDVLSSCFSHGNFSISLNRNDQNASKDFPQRIAEIIGMMKGRNMSTAPRELFDSNGVIPDKYGEFVLVPSVFAADLTRMKQFKINGVTYFDRENCNAYNPNECAREIYRLLGNAGGNRLMQACQQGTMAHFISHMVYPLTAPDGAWSAKLPGKFLNPTNAGGFDVDLKVDYEKNLVTFSRKLLMKLHTTEDPTFMAHFVAKTEISIPLDELAENDFGENKNPAPNLHVTDTISVLVINNQEEAEGLLSKF